MIPFRIKPHHFIAFLILILGSLAFQGCSGCLGCSSNGYPWADNEVGCHCDHKDGTVDNCTPADCSGPWDTDWDTNDRCDGETKESACGRLNGGNGSSTNIKCDNTENQVAPSLDVTIQNPLSVYSVGQPISFIISASDPNKDLSEIRVDFDNGSPAKSIQPTSGDRFTTVESFTPVEPGCYKVNIEAYDTQNPPTPKYLNLDVGTADICSSNSGDKRQQISLLSPRNGSSFPYGAPVSISVHARAQIEARIQRIEFYSDATLLNGTSFDTYETDQSFAWTPAKSDVGSHTLSVKVTVTSQADPLVATVKTTITDGANGLPQPSISGLPSQVTTMGRMYSTTLTIPASAGGVTIKNASIRFGTRYCGLLSESGDVCPMYDGDADVFNEAQLNDLETLNAADFLIVKSGSDGRTFTIYGIATPDEFTAYQSGSPATKLELEIEKVWTYPIQLQSSAGNSEKIAKDKIFNDMIDFTTDLLSRADPAKPVVVSALAKASANPFLPDQIQYLTMKSLKDLFAFATSTTTVVAATDLNLVTGYVKGIFEGVWGGIRDDYQGLKELIGFIWSPIDRSFEMYNTVKGVINQVNASGMSAFVDGIFKSINNTMADFLSTADQSVTWRVEKADGLAIDVGLRAYIAGYVSGYLSEQLVVAVSGAGVAAKVGKCVTTVLEASRAGRVVIGTVTAVNRFQKNLWSFATRQLQRAGELKTVSKINAKMQDIRKVILEFSDDKLGYAKELGEKYSDWNDKIETLCRSSLNDWAGSARTTLIRLVEINRKIAGQALSDLAAKGWLNVYPAMADVEAIVPNFFDYVTINWGDDASVFSLSKLDEVFQQMAADLPAIVKTPSTGVGKKIKMKGVRIYYVDRNAVPPVLEKYKTYFASDYRFTPGVADASLSRGDTYIADDYATAFYELRQKVGGKQALLVDFENDNILDFTDPAVVAKFQVGGKPLDMSLVTARYEDKAKFPDEAAGKALVYGYGQKVADAAIAQGYSGILYPSAQRAGKTNIVLFGGGYDPTKISVLKDVPTTP